MATADYHPPRNLYLTLFLCLCVAILEGFEVQAMGVAGLGIKNAFNLSKDELGWIFSVGTLGMLPGAILAGRLADKVGRKFVLIASVAIFGVMSVLTVYTTGFSTMLLVRFLNGVGMGATLPMIISMSSEAVVEKWSSMAVSIVYAGVPLGAAIIAFAAAMFTGVDGWKNVFYLSGIVPIAILPLLFLFLKETLYKKPEITTSQGLESQDNNKFKHILFEEGRLKTTVSIWVSFFGTLVVLYFILNWLPILMRTNGLGATEASNIQGAYQVGATVGVLVLGWLLTKISLKKVVILIYVGITTGLALLAILKTATGLGLAAALAGFFLTGGQSALYALAARAYVQKMRGTGVGVAVGVGRLGSFAGPLLAGMLFAYNSDVGFVIGASIPVILLAATAAIMLAINLNRQTELS